jgi:hypothetical protein
MSFNRFADRLRVDAHFFPVGKWISVFQPTSIHWFHFQIATISVSRWTNPNPLFTLYLLMPNANEIATQKSGVQSIQKWLFNRKIKLTPIVFSFSFILFFKYYRKKESLNTEANPTYRRPNLSCCANRFKRSTLNSLSFGFLLSKRRPRCCALAKKMLINNISVVKSGTSTQPPPVP